MQGCLASGLPVRLRLLRLRELHERRGREDRRGAAAAARRAVARRPRGARRRLRRQRSSGSSSATRGARGGGKGYCTMPYGYLTDPSLARDFWAIYTVEPTTTTRRARRRPASARREDRPQETKKSRATKTRRQAAPARGRARGAEHDCRVRQGAAAGDRERSALRCPRAGHAEGVLDGLGARSSTGAGWTGRRGCSASPPIRGRRNGSPTGRWSATRASGCRAFCASSG